METEKHLPLKPGTPRYDAALALEDSVRVIRRVRGKRNPEDFARGTPEWDATTEDFVKDLLWASSENHVEDHDHEDDLR
ncbi:MAG TPA: hypothetical protein VNE00_29770 [Paraburkholderia sp.]|jgi:hypothetical protein|nr:hypothetical protein [Paraburkholderia sp.]